MNGQRFGESICLSIDFWFGAEAVGNLVQGYTHSVLLHLLDKD